MLTLCVNDKETKDGFEGFGVALTGSSCYVLDGMNGADRAELLDKIYGADGLGLSVARLTIGSSDYSPEVYCYEDENDNFTIEKDRTYVLPIVKEVAKKYRDIRFFASPWSPPARMKTSKSMFGGFMREKFVPEYADYILNYIDAYAREGVKISAVTVQNETETDQGGTSAACIWHPDTEAKFALTLAEKQQNRAEKMKIMLLDHNFAMYKRVIAQYEDFPELIKAAPAVAFHYYNGGCDFAEKSSSVFPKSSGISPRAVRAFTTITRPTGASGVRLWLRRSTTERKALPAGILRSTKRADRTWVRFSAADWLR